MRTHKIAYMISAYTSAETLENLVNRLDCLEADFFIHIDRKVNSTPFYTRLEGRDNIRFLPDPLRVKVGWGGIHKLRCNAI